MKLELRNELCACIGVWRRGSAQIHSGKCAPSFHSRALGFWVCHTAAPSVEGLRLTPVCAGTTLLGQT